MLCTPGRRPRSNIIYSLPTATTRKSILFPTVRNSLNGIHRHSMKVRGK